MQKKIQIYLFISKVKVISAKPSGVGRDSVNPFNYFHFFRLKCVDSSL